MIFDLGRELALAASLAAVLASRLVLNAPGQALVLAAEVTWGTLAMLAAGAGRRPAGVVVSR